MTGVNPRHPVVMPERAGVQSRERLPTLAVLRAVAEREIRLQLPEHFLSRATHPLHEFGRSCPVFLHFPVVVMPPRGLKGVAGDEAGVEYGAEVHTQA